MNKIAFVTGDSTGIGRAVCQRLVTAGWQVYGASRRDLDPQQWTHIKVDVTDETSVKRAIDGICSDAGRLDAVVHCAGESFVAPVEDATIEEVQRHFDLNVFGTVRVLRSTIPILRQQGRGKIVIVGSIGGLIGLPFQGYYSAGKFALDGLIEALRPEIAAFGIDASIVHPGAVDTEIGQHRFVTLNCNEASPYHRAFQRAVAFYTESEQDGCSPDLVARHIEGLLNRRNMPVRSLYGTFLEKLGVFGKRTMVSRHFEYVMGLAYSPGKEDND